MTILVIAEHDNATLSDQTAKALSAALKMGGEVDILVGNTARPAAEAAAKLTAVRKVLLAEAHELSERLAEPLAGLIVALAGSYDAIVAPATASGKNLLPRVAALLDVSQISEITEVISSDTFKRPIYAGNAIQTVRSDRCQEGRHRADRFLSGSATAAPRQSRPCRLPSIRRFRSSWKTIFRTATGRN